MKPDLTTLPDDIMNRVIRRQMDCENAWLEAIAQQMLNDCMTSAAQHAEALGQGQHPGPGWWTILHIEHRDGQQPRLRMRYVWPYADDAKRAAEPSA